MSALMAFARVAKRMTRWKRSGRTSKRDERKSMTRT
jgi:hypothetical protein